jgi:hypothetical protein
MTVIVVLDVAACLIFLLDIPGLSFQRRSYSSQGYSARHGIQRTLTAAII